MRKMVELIFDRGELSHVTSVRFNEGEANSQWRSVHLRSWRSPLRASYDRKRDNYSAASVFAQTCNYERT